MKKTRIILLIVIQPVLLVVSFIYIGVLLLDDFILKSDAEYYAIVASHDEATRNFLQHGFSLYELKLYREGIDSGHVPTDGSTELASKREGQFQMFYFMVYADLPRVHREIQQAYVDGYNERMRQFLKNPEERIDTNVYRVPARELQSNTNNLPFGS